MSLLELLGGFVARSMSETERQALEAGDVGGEAELFCGRPDLERLARAPFGSLREDEQAFLDGPVATICRRIDEDRLRREGLCAADWAYLREQKFFGLLIDQQWGGLGFSAAGRCAVFARLGSRALALAAVVMIPNSVGPGELLQLHGSEEQKNRWLPGLADGSILPCFALTETEAGSDAASLRSRAVVIRRPDGSLGLRVDFEKRFITLAPVADLIGLAVHLEDPDGLLEIGTEGITVLLVPATTPGVVQGAGHDPLGLLFANGPLEGRDIELGLDAILGGAKMAGRGWPLLMEALAGGRGLSLPAAGAGGAARATFVLGAYCQLRRQFGRRLADFEGVAVPLAGIAGRSWLLDALCGLTSGAVDSGSHPAVLAGIAKWLGTENARQIALDSMDLGAGWAISAGPRNALVGSLEAAQIAITVEGANILTRSLIVYGQGALRCHRRLRTEIAAIEARSLGGFLAALGGHLLDDVALFARLGGDELGLWRFRAPSKTRDRRGWARLARASTRFAVVSELALASRGPTIKFAEGLSGRLADALGWQVMLWAALRRLDEGEGSEVDRAAAEWCRELALGEIDSALDGALAELGGRGPLAALCRIPARVLRSLWRLKSLGRGPSDAQALRLTGLLIDRPEAFDRLCRMACRSDDPDDPLGRLEIALAAQRAAAPIARKLRALRRAGSIPKAGLADQLKAARQGGLLESSEIEQLREAEALRWAALEVDTPLAWQDKKPQRPTS